MVKSSVCFVIGLDIGRLHPYASPFGSFQVVIQPPSVEISGIEKGVPNPIREHQEEVGVLEEVITVIHAVDHYAPFAQRRLHLTKETLRVFHVLEDGVGKNQVVALGKGLQDALRTGLG